MKILEEASNTNVENIGFNLKPINDGEQILGELSEELKSLFGLLIQVNDDYDQKRLVVFDKIKEHMELHLDPKNTNHNCDEFHFQIIKEMEPLEAKKTVIKNFFYSAVSAEFGYPEGELGIRQNFKVVTRSCDEENIYITLSRVMELSPMFQSIMDWME